MPRTSDTISFVRKGEMEVYKYNNNFIPIF